MDDLDNNAWATASRPHILKIHRNDLKTNQENDLEKALQPHNTKVLVVDDDEINLMVETNYLKKFGYNNVTVARNGQEAINEIQDQSSKGNNFDIIFMDCNMPVMDGYQASNEIKEMMGKGAIKPVKIIAVTANVSDSDKERCSRNGMDHFLTKPIKPDDMEKFLIV